MTVVVFVVMEALAALSLVLFGAFPLHWEVGAASVSTLNIVICAYCWYVIVAFTSFGDRDPYLYAMGGWVVCFGMRSAARMLLLFVYPLTGNDLLINSLLGALILVSAQVVLVQFLLAEQREWADEVDYCEARNAEALAQAAKDVAARDEELAQARQDLIESIRQAAEQRSADQQQALEALLIARAQRCVKCTEGCSPQVARGGASEAGVVLDGTASADGRIAISGSGNEIGEFGRRDEVGRVGIDSGIGRRDRDSGRAGGIVSVLSDSMRCSVRQMGEQFLLSDREIDVLTLYALGHTQKKVADELYITPATAHTHIKRIYAKCGMHSRQEILEYLESYA